MQKQNSELLVRDVDTISEWNKKTPTLKAIKNHLDEIVRGDKIVDTLERYKEITKIENFLLLNKKIPNQEKNFQGDKLHLLLEVAKQKNSLSEMMISNFIENPFVDEATKNNFLKKYNSGKFDIIKEFQVLTPSEK